MGRRIGVSLSRGVTCSYDSEVIRLSRVETTSVTLDLMSDRLEEVRRRHAAAEAGGGEYQSQDGFGWTNGVLITLIKKYNLKI